MQDDVTWGVKHLISTGVADPKRIGILGGSYGGYATLAGLAFTPDLYAAGVSIVGPSNLITLLESIPPYWESGRKIFEVRLGDPATTEGRAQLEERSPLNSANKIKAPLLVVQGANDPRVKKAESDQIVVALRDRGFPVEYIVADDEGHGFAKPVNNLAMFAAAERFLSKHLGGSYQESATPETAKRLKEITVDVSTVVEPARIRPESVGVPIPEADLKPGIASYDASVEIQGQTVSMKVVREIKDQGTSWLVSETTQTPAGAMTDQCWLEKKTLLLLKRWIKEGQLEIGLEVKGSSISGSMSTGAEPKTFNADAG